MWEESIKFSMTTVSYQTKIFPRAFGTFVEINGISWKIANSLFDKCESTCLFYLFLFVKQITSPPHPSPLPFLLLSSFLSHHPLPEKLGLAGLAGFASWAASYPTSWALPATLRRESTKKTRDVPVPHLYHFATL